ncbi:hypothetical protein BDN72DRAFT_798713, partial [Pluteus cervinus]
MRPPRTSKIQTILLVLVVLLTCSHGAIFWFHDKLFLYWHTTSNQALSGDSIVIEKADDLSIPRMFVISLPTRKDRREDMELLQQASNLRWTYWDAVASTDTIIDQILSRVSSLRSRVDNISDTSGHKKPHAFRWPKNLDKVVFSQSRISLSTSSFWRSNQSTNLLPLPPGQDSNLTCATRDEDILPYSDDLPEHKILTRARLACWQSHLSLLEQIANDARGRISIILEDDIDMERDIKAHLRWLFTSPPKGWDIIFLGHCWSDEAHFPPLRNFDGISTNPTGRISLHPSWSPKCTHAYAVSHHGARRLLLHLLYAPFAYSRPIDQAFAWLIQSKRLKSYSVVPSIIVQRKIGQSDVSQGIGSIWRDELGNGIL